MLHGVWDVPPAPSAASSSRVASRPAERGVAPGLSIRQTWTTFSFAGRRHGRTPPLLALFRILCNERHVEGAGGNCHRAGPRRAAASGRAHALMPTPGV